MICSRCKHKMDNYHDDEMFRAEGQEDPREISGFDLCKECEEYFDRIYDEEK
jgi:hypothetical protein